MQDELNPEDEALDAGVSGFENPDEEQDTVLISAAKNHVPYTGNLKRRVYSGMWGPLEIAAVVVGSGFLLLSLMFYLVFVVPAQNEQANGRKQRDDLDRELVIAREKWGDIKNTETRVAKLITSAEDFETRSLKDESIGTTSVYQRINVLIKTFGLRNTSGPDYVPLVSTLDAAQNKGGTTGKGGRDKFKSLFPGIYITTTVEGSYPNVRRFIKEIEGSSEFVSITSLEIEPSDDEKTQAESGTVEIRDEKGRKVLKSYKKGRFRGNVVSLRIEMAAYFRRPAEQRLNTALVADQKEGTNPSD
jgi:transcription antitermination factor NusG